MILILLAIMLASAKIIFWDYAFERFLPKTRYEVSYLYSFEGFDEPVFLSTFLPVSDRRQTITEQINSSPGMNFSINPGMSGNVGRWETTRANGKTSVSYAFEFIGEARKYLIDSALQIPSFYPSLLEDYLEATENIQANHPQIREIYSGIAADKENTLGVLTAIHEYTGQLKPMPFKGVTDALTAVRLGEASCNGMSRLFVALARTGNIPSRLVGGIILNDGSKRTSHQWVEAYISGEWVPFDPLNDHFAYIPHNFLKLYTGDEFVYTHTPNINFDYTFKINSSLSANPVLYGELASHPLNAYELWEAFDSIGVPIGLLKIILLLPLGAFVVAIFRNVIGFNTFGVFLPALIAVASRETGLGWGIVAFLLVIGIVSIAHFPLQKWGILYTPKLVIMLVLVVILFLLISYFAIGTGLISLAYVTLFPIVVLTISAERFARKIDEDGFREALLVTLQTLVVVVIAFYVMNSRSMETFFLAFPEFFLAIIGLNILLGRWVGIRMLEYYRFRALINNNHSA
ncbi:MAG: 7TM domain-containing protein [Bacteroidales bacterium]|nr:7TM domain-containing protein [Bacteroidales bacterium]MDT8430724.1 7TM domain-containing protein [Bacteroidales bacterium]